MKKYFTISLIVLIFGLWMNLYGAHNISDDAIDTIGQEGIPELIEAAESTDPQDDELRIKAIQRLGQLKAKESLDVIVDILSTKRFERGGKEIYNWKLKVVSANTLADIGDERAVPYLADIVWKDPDLLVKRAAVQALGKMGEMSRKRTVLEILHSELIGTRDNAYASDICEALGKIGDKSSFVYLLRVTQGPYLNYVKEMAQKSIAMTKWEKASVLDEGQGGSTNASVSQYKK